MSSVLQAFVVTPGVMNLQFDPAKGNRTGICQSLERQPGTAEAESRVPQPPASAQGNQPGAQTDQGA